MSTPITKLIIQLVARTLGGNAVGTYLKDDSPGAIGNTIAEAVGGAAGQVLQGLIPL